MGRVLGSFCVWTKAALLYSCWLLVDFAQCVVRVAGEPIRAKLINSGFTDEQIKKLAQMHRDGKQMPDICWKWFDSRGQVKLAGDLIAVKRRRDSTPDDGQVELEVVPPVDSSNRGLLATKTATAAAPDLQGPLSDDGSNSSTVMDFDLVLHGDRRQQFNSLYCLFAGLGYDLSGFSPSPEDAPPLIKSLIAKEVFSEELYDHLRALWDTEIWPMITSGVRGYIAALERQAHEEWDATPLASKRTLRMRVSLRYEHKQMYPHWHIDQLGRSRLRYSLTLFGAPTVIDEKLTYPDCEEQKLYEKYGEGTGITRRDPFSKMPGDLGPLLEPLFEPFSTRQSHYERGAFFGGGVWNKMPEPPVASAPIFNADRRLTTSLQRQEPGSASVLLGSPNTPRTLQRKRLLGLLFRGGESRPNAALHRSPSDQEISFFQPQGAQVASRLVLIVDQYP
ncbi:unnamed protein product [Amoebophrya sp. A25]|nr:unnamed protein product [Amoebophrya sp. A25]|eukprot:GSA25T00003073001.1